MSTKPFYQSKTLWVNLLVALAAIGAYVAGPDFPVQLSADNLELVALAVAVINGVLRFTTNSGIK